MMQKAFGASLLRSTDVPYDAHGDEVARALCPRRALPAVPRVRALRRQLRRLAAHPAPLRVPARGRAARHPLAAGVQAARRLDDLTADWERVLDRRLVLAVAVGMDALQAR